MFGLGLSLPAIVAHNNRLAAARAAASNKPTLPRTDLLMRRFKSTDVPAQVDNTPVTSWTDSVAGVAIAQATNGKQPAYRTNRQGGKPSVQFAGAQCLINNDRAIMDALASKGTVILIAKGVAPSTDGNPFPTALGMVDGNGTGPLWMRLDTWFGRQQSVAQVPVQDSGFAVFAMTHSTGAAATRHYYNGGCVQQGAVYAPAATADARFTVGGATQSGGFNAVFEAFEVLIYTEALTPIEMAQLQNYACAEYGATHPLAGRPYNLVFDGDSLTSGLGADLAAYNYPNRAAASLGLKYGQYSMLSIGGIQADGMSDKAPVELDGLAAVTGAPTALVASEFFNDQSSTAQMVGYLQARRAAGVSRIAWWTSIDYDDAQGFVGNRTTYNAWFNTPANYAGLIDVVARVDQDTQLGVEGAFTAYPQHWSDYVHLKGTGDATIGYGRLATVIAPAVQTLLGSA